MHHVPYDRVHYLAACAAGCVAPRHSRTRRDSADGVNRSLQGGVGPLLRFAELRCGHLRPTGPGVPRPGIVRQDGWWAMGEPIHHELRPGSQSGQLQWSAQSRGVLIIDARWWGAQKPVAVGKAHREAGSTGRHRTRVFPACDVCASVPTSAGSSPTHASIRASGEKQPAEAGSTRRPAPLQGGPGTMAAP